MIKFSYSFFPSDCGNTLVIINDQLRSMGPDLVSWLDEVIYSYNFWLGEVIYSHNFCGNRLLTQNVWFNFLIFRMPYQAKFRWTKFRRTKYFGGQLFRHLLEISAVLSDEKFFIGLLFPIHL